jgi:hypothetical protein
MSDGRGRIERGIVGPSGPRTTAASERVGGAAGQSPPHHR